MTEKYFFSQTNIKDMHWYHTTTYIFQNSKLHILPCCPEDVHSGFVCHIFKLDSINLKKNKLDCKLNKNLISQDQHFNNNFDSL